MNHRSGLRKLNITDSAHRRAMFRNMSNSLILHERIKTTAVRAKELRRFLEPLVTISKTASVANRRLVFSRLHDRSSVTKLFDDIGVRVADRPGGYLRVLKCGFRPGDNAMMALIEFVDRIEEAKAEPKKLDKKSKVDKANPKAVLPVVEPVNKETVVTATSADIQIDASDTAENSEQSTEQSAEQKQ